MNLYKYVGPIEENRLSAASMEDRTDGFHIGIFVIGAYISFVLVAIGFVTVYGNNVPRWEEWFFVPIIAGKQAVSLSWLWGDSQGSRTPLPSLCFIICYSLFGFDSKPILYLNVLLLSISSLLLIWAIRKVRGRWNYADVFFPIVLLNLGQTESFCWALVMPRLSATCLEIILLIVIATNRGALCRTSMILSAACILIMPLTFPGGLIFAAVMLPWLSYQGWLMERISGGSDLKVHPVALGAAALTALTTGLYFVGYQSHRLSLFGEYVKPGLYAYAKTSVKYLSTAFGGGAVSPFRYLPGILAVATALAAGLCLLRALVRGRLTWDPRAVGLASFLAACLAVTMAVGLGRYSWGDYVLSSHNSAASVVVLIACYFIWELHAPTSLVSLGRMILFTAATSFLYANLQHGYASAVALKEAESDFLRGLRAAEPIPRLVAHHAGITFYSHKHLEGYLRQLRDAGVPPYDRLPPDRPIRVSPLPPAPDEVRDIDREGDGWRIRGSEPLLGFTLEKPEFVTGLRFRFSQTDPEGLICTMRVGWQKEGRPELQYYRAIAEMYSGGESEIVVYIDDRISRVVIVPSSRITSFRLSNIELLLP